MDASAQLTTGLAGRYIIGRVLGYGAAWSGLADAGRKASPLRAMPEFRQMLMPLGFPGM